LSKTDLILLLFLLFGAWSGYRKGFLMSLFSLIAVVLGILGGFRLMDWGIEILKRELDINSAMLPYVSFLIIFILILIGVKLIGNLLRNMIDETFLGTADKFLGAALGIAKYIFVMSVLLWICTALSLNLPEQWSKDSIILPYLVKIAPMISTQFSKILPIFKELIPAA
jgi:membrane protein required for colicin V production